MAIERIRRKEPTTPNPDFTVPINIEAEQAKSSDTCYGVMWDMTQPACIMCADSDMCGVLYTNHLDKVVKEAYKEVGRTPLDSLKFDTIDKSKLLVWLKTPKPAKELAKMVQTASGCDDRSTVIHWVKSFVASHPQLIMENGIIRYK